MASLGGVDPRAASGLFAAPPGAGVQPSVLGQITAAAESQV